MFDLNSLDHLNITLNTKDYFLKNNDCSVLSLITSVFVLFYVTLLPKQTCSTLCTANSTQVRIEDFELGEGQDLYEKSVQNMNCIKEYKMYSITSITIQSIKLDLRI